MKKAKHSIILFKVDKNQRLEMKAQNKILSQKKAGNDIEQMRMKKKKIVENFDTLNSTIEL